MVDNVNITPGSGVAVAADDVSGVLYQRVKPAFGADGSATDVNAGAPLPVQLGDSNAQANILSGDTGQNSQLMSGARKEVTFTTTTAQAVASTDVSNYRWVSVHITGQGTSSTVTFQGSNDNSNWVNIPLMTSTSTAGPVVNATTATGILHGPIFYRFFRLNVTGISAGTTVGVIEFFAYPAGFQGLGVDTELPAAAALSDTGTNPATPMVGADGMLYNGATWERARAANTAQGTSGTGVSAAGNMGFDGTNWRRARVDASGNLGVTIDAGILLDRIENLEMALRQLLNGAGGQPHDGVGRTRVTIDGVGGTALASGTSLPVSGTLTAVTTVTGITGIGGQPGGLAISAMVNGGFEVLRRGIAVS